MLFMIYIYPLLMSAAEEFDRTVAAQFSANKMHDTKHATTSNSGNWRKRPFVTYCLYSLLFLFSFLHVFNAFGRDYYPLQLAAQSETGATLDWERVKKNNRHF